MLTLVHMHFSVSSHALTLAAVALVAGAAEAAVAVDVVEAVETVDATRLGQALVDLS